SRAGVPRLRRSPPPLVRGGARSGSVASQGPSPQYGGRQPYNRAEVRAAASSADLTSRPDAMSSVQLADLTVDSLLERLASSDPAPGGGSGSALAGAMAAG